MDREVRFARMYEAHARGIYNYARRFLGDRQEAEEAAQDILVRIYERLPDGDPAALKAWCYRVATTCLLNRVRSPWWRWRKRRRDPGTGPAVPATDEKARGDLEAVRAAMMRLRERERAGLLMFMFDGLSQAEIARALGITEGHVKVLIHRAREFLKKATEGEA